jgi:hypothetical protein
VSCMCTVTQITQMCRSAGCLSDLCLCMWNNFTVLMTTFFKVPPPPKMSLSDVPLPFSVKWISYTCY